MNKPIFTRQEVLDVLNDILQRPDALIDAISNENTDIGAEELLETAEQALYVKLSCMNCGVEFLGTAPEMCCNGYQCGCMGQPVEPVICSPHCYDMIINKNR